MNPVEQPAQPNPFFEKTSKILGIAWTLVTEIPDQITATVVVAAALRILYAPLSAPFMIVSGSSILTRLSLKVLDYYHFNLSDKTKLSAIEFLEKYPYVPLISMIFSIVIYQLSIPLGILIGIGAGIIEGLRYDLGLAKQKYNLFNLFSLLSKISNTATN